MEAFETERLRLRPLRAEDLGPLHAIYSDPSVAPWIGVHTLADTRKELERAVAAARDGGLGLWAVEERTSGRFIGDGGLQPFEGRGPEIELGYDLAPDAWGRGYATELARAWLAVAFGSLGLDEVIAVVKPAHRASRRVLEKAGMTQTGTRHAYGEALLLYVARSPPA